MFRLKVCDMSRRRPFNFVATRRFCIGWSLKLCNFCGKKASREKKTRRERRCLNKNCTFGWSRSHFRFEKTDAEVANFEEESFQRWISLMKKVFGTQRGTYWTRTQPPEILLIEHPHKLTLKRASHHPCESFIYWARVSSLKCKANVVSTNSCHTRIDIV